MTEYETRTIDGRPVVVTETAVEPRRGGGFIWILLALVIAAAIAAFAFGLVSVDQTSSGSLPKVETSGGSLPGFDVDTGKVAVGTTTKSVEVPTVSVDTQQKTVEVPTLSVEPASNSNGQN